MPGKHYKAAAEKVDRARSYPLSEGIDLLLETRRTKFDETAEVAMNLGVDPRHADQNVRGAIALPHGTGKSVRAEPCAHFRPSLYGMGSEELTVPQPLVSGTAQGYLTGSWKPAAVLDNRCGLTQDQSRPRCPPPGRIIHASLALTPGTHLGPYEIAAQIGVGGQARVGCHAPSTGHKHVERRAVLVTASTALSRE